MTQRSPKVLEEPGSSPQIEEQPQPEQGEAVYAVVSGADRFDSGIEGLDVLTRLGTPVPADKVDQLKQSAKNNDVTIRKVG